MGSPSHGSLSFGSVLLAVLLVLAAGGRGEAVVGGETDGGADANTCSSLSPRATQGTTDSCETIEGAAGDDGDSTGFAELPEVEAVKFNLVSAASDSLRYNHMAMLEWLPGPGFGRTTISSSSSSSSGSSSEGRLVIAWQAARASEGSASQVLLTAYSDDMGASWSRPQKLQPQGRGVLWSPVLHRLEGPEGSVNEELLLFYSESSACMRPPKQRDGVITGEPRWNPGGDIKVVSSLDMGETWGKPRMVHSQAEDGGIPKVIANRLHVVKGQGEGGRGRLLLPFWRERARGATFTAACPDLIGGGHETSGVLISDDGGRSWAAAGRIRAEGTWLIEGTIADAGDGSLLMMLRSAADAVWASRSYDLGLTWSPPEPLPLPNPNSKVSVVSLGSWGGLLVAALNHHPRLRGGHARTRSQLALVGSRDGGASWTLMARLEDSMSPGNWYHYPTVMEAGPNRLLVAYSAQHTAEMTDGIKLATVTLRAPSGASCVLPPPPQQTPESSLIRLRKESFSASSTHPDCRAASADLYSSGSWCSASIQDDPNQWLQVDLPGLMNVTHVVTAGRPDSRTDQRVTAYSLSFTRDGWRWQPYAGRMQGHPGTEELVLTGNVARGTVQINRLLGADGSLGITAAAVRFHPVRWSGHMSMQVGVSSSENVSAAALKTGDGGIHVATTSERRHQDQQLKAAAAGSTVHRKGASERRHDELLIVILIVTLILMNRYCSR